MSTQRATFVLVPGAWMGSWIWADAVTLWATTLVTDRMATPKDLIHAAYLTRDKWEQHPDRRALLEAHRAATLEANYRRMGIAPTDEHRDEVTAPAGAPGTKFVRRPDRPQMTPSAKTNMAPSATTTTSNSRRTA